MLRFAFASVLALFALCSTSLADTVLVNGVRVWSAPDNTRIVFDLSSPVRHNVFTLSSPERLVVDLMDARLTTSETAVDLGNGLLKGIRTAPREQDNGVRIVFDLKAQAQPKSFLLRPYGQYGHRLVVDLFTAGGQQAGAQPAVAQASQPAGNPAPRPSSPRNGAQAAAPKVQLRDLVIAIDAGHGGEDPGAIGPGGTREKDVVLAVARKLEALVRQEKGMRPVMIRDGDYFIPLRQRTKKARQHKADLFISIHADAAAVRGSQARGSSVYTLSERGATTEAARWLAERENASDLVGGVSLDDKDDLLASVLLDLSQAATNEASMEVAHEILKELGRVGEVHKRRVEQAGFIVLKSPDIPSVLVETAFISNPAEERRLRDARYQQQLAQAIMNGIRAYFVKRAPLGTIYAAREHVIERGDTLTMIAKRYQVHPDNIRAANGLTDDRLEVGTVLRIPISPGG